MDVRDLRHGPPRRWNESVDGVVWLPRLIDKIRAQRAGSLGTYLLGQSPIDDELLACMPTTYAGLARIVDAAASDAAVLDGLDAAFPGSRMRLQTWSAALPARRALHLRVLDLDDGYTGNAFVHALGAVVNVPFALVVALLRAIRPVRL
jgi:hypothetical protein